MGGNPTIEASQPPSIPAPPRPANQNTVTGWLPSAGPNASAAPQEHSTASATMVRQTIPRVCR